MRFVKSLISAVYLCGLSGCATTSEPQPDPLEPVNRVIYSANSTLDSTVLKPVAQAYSKRVPESLQVGTTNFFANIDDAWSTLNHFLQWHPYKGVTGVVRVAANSTFGVFGVFDVATKASLPRRRTDFGQTLGRWGVPAGPYLVIPLLGPSTLRDASGSVLSLKYDVLNTASSQQIYAAGQILRIVDGRSMFLAGGDLLDEISFDQYIFVRDAYLQKRKNQVADAISND